MTDQREPTPQYEGICHCGAVRFIVWIRTPATIQKCNCSICLRTAYLHIIVPKTEFRLLTGESQLLSYTFGTGTAKHLFCKFCGVKTFYIPRSHPAGYSVNARCLKDFETSKQKLEQFDGRNYELNIAALRKKSDFV